MTAALKLLALTGRPRVYIVITHTQRHKETDTETLQQKRNKAHIGGISSKAEEELISEARVIRALRERDDHRVAASVCVSSIDPAIASRTP